MGQSISFHRRAKRMILRRGIGKKRRPNGVQSGTKPHLRLREQRGRGRGKAYEVSREVNCAAGVTSRAQGVGKGNLKRLPRVHQPKKKKEKAYKRHRGLRWKYARRMPARRNRTLQGKSRNGAGHDNACGKKRGATK